MANQRADFCQYYSTKTRKKRFFFSFFNQVITRKQLAQVSNEEAEHEDYENL